MLLLGRMSSSCECSTISASSKMLWPGEVAEFTINYNTEDEPLGDFSKDFYIETNDPFHKEIKFTITGRVLGEAKDQNKVVYLAYFYSLGCQRCKKVKDILQDIKQRFPNLNVREFNIDLRENRVLAEAIAKAYNLPEERTLVPPMVIVGKNLLIGEEIKQGKLDEFLFTYSKEGTLPPWWSLAETQPQAVKQAIIQRFKSFGPLLIMFAGLVDGINPCAFTMMVFFVSFLVFAGYGRREMISTGSCFTLAVFLTYLLIGFGLFKFFQTLKVYTFLSRLVYFGIALSALGLGVISLYDYWRYRRTGKTEVLKLQLPHLIKHMIHKVIRIQMNSPQLRPNSVKLGLSAFIAGFVVSLLESACTGQVYLPTIVFVMGLPELRARAFLYLVFYNLMFILPLIAIFLIALKGATSERFACFARRHLGKVKLVTAIFFFGLGAMLLVIR